jgi:hypothetical protein
VALLATGSVLYGQWVYAVRNGLVARDAPPEIVQATGNRILFGLAGYVVALGFLLISPLIGLALYILIPLLYLRRAGIDRHLAADHRKDRLE